MSCVQLSEGSFQVVFPLGLWSSHPELSKSYMAMASKLLTVRVVVVVVVCSKLLTVRYCVSRWFGWGLCGSAARPACDAHWVSGLGGLWR